MEEQGSRTRLKCPKCEKTASIPEGGINALPKDLHKSYEAKCARYTSRIESEEEINCDKCDDTTKAPAVSFCVECCEFICPDCMEHHKSLSQSLSHELVPVGDRKSKCSSDGAMTFPHKPMRCHQHEDETVEFFCTSCSTLTCRNCMSFEHSGHTYDRIEKVAEAQKTELSATLKSADGAKASLDDACAEGGKVMQQVQCRQKVVKENIRTTFKVLYNVLSKRETWLLAKAAETGLSKQRQLTIQGEEFSALHKEIEETCDLIATAIQSYTPTEMLSVKGAMTNRLEQLLKQCKRADFEPCRSDAMYILADTSELVGKISSFGRVVGSSCPRNAKTDLHLATAVVGKEKKVNITTYDADGQRFPIGGERIDVSLPLMGSGDPPLTTEVHVLDNKDGTYVASFIPQEIGMYPLGITFDREYIKGSPFPVYVRQERSYTSLSGQLTFSLSSQPYDVAVDDSNYNGDVYVAVCGNHCIEVFNQSGNRIRTIGTPGSPGSGVGQFNHPSAIAIRGSLLYVADSKNNRVQMLNTWGDFISQFGNNHLSNPRGICLDKDGVVFVSSCGNNMICIFDADGTHISDISGSTFYGSSLNGPWGVAFDCSGNLHVADTNTNTIEVFTPQGQYVTSYNSGVSFPAGIAIDDEGHTFIGENYYHSSSGYSHLCILDSQHQVINSPRLVQSATGVAVDNKGSLFLCDYDNCCVYKY